MVRGSAISPCPTLTHGNVLPHNFVTDSTHLHLIDIDEGVGGADKLYERRIMDDAGEDHWLTAMSYRNVA
jgi:hypothetical protein